MLEKCGSYSKQRGNNVAMLCCAKIVVANRLVQHHLKTRKQAFSGRSHAKTGKEMYKQG